MVRHLSSLLSMIEFLRMLFNVFCSRILHVFVDMDSLRANVDNFDQFGLVVSSNAFEY